MIERIKGDNLIIGEKYYVKIIRKTIKCSSKNISGIFLHYNEEYEDYAWFKVGADYIELRHNVHEFYRYVSKEEFYGKMKEKYDAKCLNIILKTLVDDMFEW